MNLGNPFKFGKEVGGYQFYDRVDDARRLRQKMIDGSSNVVLFAPRRYGKTSLVQKVLQQLAVEDGIKSLCFDLTKTPTVELFCQGYANAVYRALRGHGDLTQSFMRYLAIWNPSFSLDVAGVATFKLNVNVNVGIMADSIASVLDLPERIAQDLGGIPFVVAFDEFQEVADISAEFPLEKIFRSCIQAHKNVRYVFLGSKTHMMKRMFGDAARPFYNSASLMPLPKPPVDESREFLCSRFRAAGIELGDGHVDSILRISQNTPYYLQELASGIFEIVSQDNRSAVEDGDLSAAVADIVARNSELFDVRVDMLSVSKYMLVRALAKEPTGIFNEAYRMRHGLSVSSTVHTSLKELIEEGIVTDDRNSRTYELSDPFFSHYLTQDPGKVFP